MRSVCGYAGDERSSRGPCPRRSAEQSRPLADVVSEPDTSDSDALNSLWQSTPVAAAIVTGVWELSVGVLTMINSGRAGV